MTADLPDKAREPGPLTPAAGERAGDVNDLRVPLLDLSFAHSEIREELREAVLGVLESNRFIGGPELTGLEQEIAEYCGVRHAMGVSSGTDALLASLMALGIGSGDDVIVPTFTFFSTAGSVHRAGARAVFCDVGPDSFNIDVHMLESLVTERVKAVIPVHLFGQSADMDAINAICRPRGISVIEDAAQAMGAELSGQRTGSLGDLGCFSFYPSKNLSAIGDAGLVTTSNDELADKIRTVRNHGETDAYRHTLVGANFRMDSIQAAALRVKLKGVEALHNARRRNAALYTEGFADLEADGLLALPKEEQGKRHVFNQYVIRVHQRDELRAYLKERNIDSAIYYPVPLHLQECFMYLGYREGSLPVSEKAAAEVLALPIFPGLTTGQIDKVIDCVRNFLLKHSRPLQSL